jgi:antitoxin VapB
MEAGTMGLTIDNEALVAMIRDLAERKGVSADEALREALEREARRETEVARKVARLIGIAREAHALPVLGTLTEDEILGYDERGLPSR